jgi:2'-5' RNA ligase
MLRLFLAVDLPDQLRRNVAALCGQVTNARWTKPEQLHITLRFMGKTPEEALPEIRCRLSEIRRPAFELSLDGAGVFPEGAQPMKARVLWLGIRGAEALAALKSATDKSLDGVAPPEEKSGFSPHLTLARFPRRPDQTLDRFLDANRGFRSTDWKVTCFRLYKSTLSSKGALHEVIDAYSLGY